jgi:hypothetical protein
MLIRIFCSNTTENSINNHAIDLKFRIIISSIPILQNIIKCQYIILNKKSNRRKSV